MMARYIDIEPVISYLTNDSMKSLSESIGDNHVARLLLEEPVADVEEVRHGEWIKNNTLCSNCNEVNPTVRLTVENEYEGRWLRRCPNCGAKMGGGKPE